MARPAAPREGFAKECAARATRRPRRWIGSRRASRRSARDRRGRGAHRHSADGSRGRPARPSAMGSGDTAPSSAPGQGHQSTPAHSAADRPAHVARRKELGDGRIAHVRSLGASERRVSGGRVSLRLRIRLQRRSGAAIVELNWTLSVRVSAPVSPSTGRDLPPSFWFLWFGTVINRLGGFAVPFLMLYLTARLGITPATAALMVSVLGRRLLPRAAAPAASSSDRLGRRPVMMMSFFVSPVAMLALGLVRETVAARRRHVRAGLLHGPVPPGDERRDRRPRSGRQADARLRLHLLGDQPRRRAGADRRRPAGELRLLPALRRRRAHDGDLRHHRAACASRRRRPLEIAKAARRQDVARVGQALRDPMLLVFVVPLPARRADLFAEPRDAAHRHGRERPAAERLRAGHRRQRRAHRPRSRSRSRGAPSGCRATGSWPWPHSCSASASALRRSPARCRPSRSRS